MKAFSARITELSDGSLMATIVDEEILGVKVRDEKRGIVIDVSPAFYAGKGVSEEEALAIMREASVLILIGRRIIEIAERAGYANRAAVLRIGEIEYVQIFKMPY